MSVDSEYGGVPGLIQPPPHDPTGAQAALLLLRQQARGEASTPDTADVVGP
jgi:hypothetical protein